MYWGRKPDGSFHYHTSEWIKIPYSCFIVKPGFLLFISGQLGLDPKTGKFAGPDLASQARQALENLKQVVVAAGYNFK